MARPHKIWFREGTGWWMVKIGGIQHKLAQGYENKDAARALQQFKDIEATNPDNADIKAIIANLEAGKAPITPATNPVKSGTLPVKETATKENL